MAYVYLVQAGEWETEPRYACVSRKVAEEKRIELAKEYSLSEEDFEYIDDFIQIDKIELIE